MSAREPPLRGQEHAVTYGESKQEPPKAALLPTAEISVPLAGKSAGGGPCPSPPFPCRHSSPRSPFSPAKCCLCSLGSRSRWWADYCFPDLVSPPLLYLLCLLVHLDLSWVGRESRRAFQSRLWGNFLALRGTAVRAMKDHQHLRDLTGSLQWWFRGSWANVTACCCWKEDISLPASVSPNTHIHFFPCSSAPRCTDLPFLLHQLQLSSAPLARTHAISSLDFISVSYLAFQP